MQIPYFDFVTECPDCNSRCHVRIFNGLKNFDLGPSFNKTHNNEMVGVLRCTNEHAYTAIQYCFEDGPHSAPFIILWAEDQKTYDLLCKLCINYSKIKDIDDGEGSEGSHGKPH